MLLEEAKPHIDAGQTAKLIRPRQSMLSPEIVIRIALVGSEYVWQRASIVSTTVNRGPNTCPFQTWGDLLQEITGEQTVSPDWTICNDALEGLEEA